MAKTCFMYDCHSIAGHEPPVTLVSLPPPLDLPRASIESCDLPSSPTCLSDTSVTMFGVNPTNQADLLSCDVPVLPAMGRSSGWIQSLPEPDWTTCCIANSVSAMTSAANTFVDLSTCLNAT